jgi:hypothetical protein
MLERLRVDPAGPVVLGPAGAVMVLVAVVATFVPARHASHAAPSALLRSE